MSLREQRAKADPGQKREDIHNKIKEDYYAYGVYHVTRTEQRNIMLIGRTRTGKSTIKSLLVDPTVVPSDLTLKSDTREPIFESFHVKDNQVVLNVIDTPGLFEHSNTEIDIRDNDAILRTIELCANREITKFHVVCFCVAITAGINREDIESLNLLSSFLGKEISRNSCLIVTRCESKTEEQRDKMRSELKDDIHFKEIADFFQLGIFFSGSLNPDDYNRGNA
jgi:GTPase Era involved in 16S rRNA processing